MSLKIEEKILRVNNQLCYFSTNGKYLAIAFQVNLILKNVKTWNTIRSFIFSDIIEYIEWAPNNEYILCANITKAIVQVYSLNYPQWKYKLIEGSAGLASITWSSNNKHLLTLSELNIQVSVWSLEDNSVLHISNLKSSVFNKLMFSPNGDRLAVIITDNGHETVDIYKTFNWKISRFHPIYQFYHLEIQLQNIENHVTMHNTKLYENEDYLVSNYMQLDYTDNKYLPFVECSGEVDLHAVANNNPSYLAAMENISYPCPYNFCNSGQSVSCINSSSVNGL
ncbi:WD repeat-containing protein WRAP73-like isoform X3 [Vespula squamosa]|uniref:WD repeat-containing protein WRAP73-like isoform X3 n=1 Tax=Vespula squamosa TaxID=30214 RepID=A0ABD2B2L7_VESSQ